MSKTVDTPQDCSVCDNKTTLACSNCQTTFFCSTECQRPMWASHQFTCGKPESPFIVRPLSSREMLALWACGRALIVDEECPIVAGKTFLEIIRDLGLFEGTWDELMPELLGGGSRIQEPFLSPCLLFARAFVANAIIFLRSQDANKTLSRFPLSSTAWNTFASRSMPIVVEYLNLYPVKSTSTSPFERIIPYLGQELVVSTLLGYGSSIHGSPQLYSCMEVAVRRLLEALRQACSTFGGDLERSLLKHIDYNMAMLADLGVQL